MSHFKGKMEKSQLQLQKHPKDECVLQYFAKILGNESGLMAEGKRFCIYNNGQTIMMQHTKTTT